MFQVQFGRQYPKVSKYPLIGISRSQGPKSLISVLYSQLLRAKLSGMPLKIRNRWRDVLPDVTEEKWQIIYSSHVGVSPINNKQI